MSICFVIYEISLLGRPKSHSIHACTQEIVKIKQCELQSMAHVALEGKEAGKPIVQKYLRDNTFAKITRESTQSICQLWTLQIMHFIFN